MRKRQTVLVDMMSATAKQILRDVFVFCKVKMWSGWVMVSVYVLHKRPQFYLRIPSRPVRRKPSRRVLTLRPERRRVYTFFWPVSVHLRVLVNAAEMNSKGCTKCAKTCTQVVAPDFCVFCVCHRVSPSIRASYPFRLSYRITLRSGRMNTRAQASW